MSGLPHRDSLPDNSTIAAGESFQFQAGKLYLFYRPRNDHPAGPVLSTILCRPDGTPGPISFFTPCSLSG